VTDEREAHRAIAAGVHGYILLCACIAASNRPYWSPALALYFGAYLWTLSRRPAREQI
jgi:hypothetical protein